MIARIVMIVAGLGVVGFVGAASASAWGVENKVETFDDEERPRMYDRRHGHFYIWYHSRGHRGRGRGGGFRGGK